MKKNIGKSDMFIRALVGVALLLNIIQLKTGIVGSAVLIALAGVLFYSAYSGYCPLYTLLKTDTCSGECPTIPDKSQTAAH
ncbi:MAG TPA: DUF2892 domain-containing protein [Spirochaetota bacterium]|nr:DUF2892 domain-containing protein [Spirochaetota bacterium]HNT12200.1 DUF2892 domain-containing protein [Spirochaetota bacterium]HOS39555.1 DUF2892 domain-containing protein [Spirochaetota bacterium]HPU89911.1 DUF2892 domain-containing protein [Spirochaetota bacterium]